MYKQIQSSFRTTTATSSKGPGPMLVPKYSMLCRIESNATFKEHSHIFAWAKNRSPRRVHFWLVYTFQLNLHWVQQKPMCHLNLANLMDVEKRHITNSKCRDFWEQGKSFLKPMNKGVLSLSALTGDADSELASPSSEGI
ncbi:hypothetical protein J6590_087990 [Homalodisca vitripennis]|nr:hypothetical protein J6590_087990 [Homalodisca vitripennis]